MLLVAGCASSPPALPRNVSVGATVHRWPAPAVAPSGAAPAILAVSFSSLDVARGGIWRGRFVTSTNVKSLVVRSNLFAINVPRLSAGRFAFTLNVFDIPPIFLRAYRVRVIASNRYGVTTEEDVPFRIR